MAKELTAKVKLLVPGGEATPAPPVGPALGQHGVNLGEFVRRFNEATKIYKGMDVVVDLSIYRDRSFEMLIKGPPVSVLLKKAAGIPKGSGTPNKEKLGQVTLAQVEEIIQQKKQFLNASNLEKAVSIVKGTARSMGIEVVP